MRKSVGAVPIPRLSFFTDFVRAESTAGLLLAVCTVAALVWANSPVASTYAEFWQTKVTIGLGTLSLTKPLLLWVNDGLMALFFLVVGLEIKRELLVGELADARRAALPLVAALGGMVVPSALYAAFNFGNGNLRGWAIPMATDIAFVLAIVALLGNRVPSSLKVFLTALAIVDDIGAVLVIAFVYSEPPAVAPLLGAGATFLLLILMARMGVRHPRAYTLGGVVLWLLVLKSGLHATLAGVLLAVVVPARAPLDGRSFLERGRELLATFDKATRRGTNVLSDDEQHYALLQLRSASRQALTPLQRLEDGFHPWVSYLVLPVFALANAGVAITWSASMDASIAVGIAAGLLIGKPIGIVGSCLLAVRFGLARLPHGVGMRQLVAGGILSGIGFTMSIFLASLSFDGEALALSKLAILASSLCAAVLGSLLLTRR